MTKITQLAKAILTLPEPVRAWLYRVVTAVLPILATYGIITKTDAVLFAGLAAAVLSSGLAALNTSTERVQQ